MKAQETAKTANLPPVRVINLDRSADRLARIGKHLDDLGIPFERHAGIDGAAAPEAMAVQQSRAGALAYMRRPLRDGEVACAMSHFAVWESLADLDGDTVLLFEDDAMPDEAIFEVPGLIDALPDNWEILLLSSLPGKVPLWSREVGGRRLVRYFRPGVYGTAYVVHRRILKRRAAWRRPVRFSLDLWRFWVWRHGFIVYTAEPHLVGFKTGLTSIISGKRSRKRTGGEIGAWGYLLAVLVRAGLYPLAALRYVAIRLRGLIAR